MVSGRSAGGGSWGGVLFVAPGARGGRGGGGGGVIQGEVAVVDGERQVGGRRELECDLIRGSRREGRQRVGRGEVHPRQRRQGDGDGAAFQAAVVDELEFDQALGAAFHTALELGGIGDQERHKIGRAHV